MEFVILKLGVKNLNDRTYTLQSVEYTIMIANQKIKEFGFIVGEYGMNSVRTISLKGNSFLIKNIYVDNLDRVVIDVDFLNNEFGKNLKENINDYMFFAKGTGMVNHDTTVDNYTFITAYCLKNDDPDYGDPYKNIYTQKELRFLKLKEIIGI